MECKKYDVELYTPHSLKELAISKQRQNTSSPLPPEVELYTPHNDSEYIYVF